MDKDSVFSKLGSSDSVYGEEAHAKAQIARRLGLGFVIITVLLGILFLAENQFGDPNEVATVVPKSEPPANLTINTPDNRDAPRDLPPQEPSSAGAQNAQEVGGQITPAQPSIPEPVAQIDNTPGAEGAVSNGQNTKPATGKSSTNRHFFNRSTKPVPGVIPTTPLKAATQIAPPVSPTISSTAETRKTAPRLLNGVLLQAGVFSNFQKAEELHALLTLNGIPSTLETRVQVGPFSTKAEAEAAREKLKSLGVDSLVMPTRK